MHRSTRNVISILISVVLLVGCGWFSNPLKDIEKRLGVQVQPTTVTVNNGALTFYRYVQGQQCGTGFVYDLYGYNGSGGGGNGPCTDLRPFSLNTANAHAGGPGDRHPFAVIYGELRDQRIVRVSVAMKGEAKPLEAQVIGGWWYVFLDGQQILPDYEKTVGYDKDGQEVSRVP